MVKLTTKINQNLNGIAKWLVLLACFSLGVENLTFQVNCEEDYISFQRGGEITNVLWGGLQLMLHHVPFLHTVEKVNSTRKLFCHILVLKGTLSGLRQFLATASPLKMMKNVFYFTLKVILC